MSNHIKCLSTNKQIKFLYVASHSCIANKQSFSNRNVPGNFFFLMKIGQKIMESGVEGLRIKYLFSLIRCHEMGLAV